MYIWTETIDFLQFILVGIILAIIFDFFRAYRKYKKVSKKIVLMQDLLYFLIVWVVIILSMIGFMSAGLRLYLIIGAVLGIMLYISVFSRYIIKMYIRIFKVNHEFILLFLLPFKLTKIIFQKICSFLKKKFKKCCKISINMLLSIYNKLKKIKMFKIQINFKNHKKKIKEAK